MEQIKIYQAKNEPVLSYMKGSKERSDVEETYNQMFNSRVDIPLYIGSEKILTNERKNILPPHDHKNVVGTYSVANKKHVENAIENNLKVKESWSNMHWSERCDIFLKAADLVSKEYRAKITVGTMIGQMLRSERRCHQLTLLMGGDSRPESCCTAAAVERFISRSCRSG